MHSLTLDLFTQSGTDLEAAQYRILAALTGMERSFHHNSLYPGLADLLELNAILETIRRNSDSLTRSGARTLTGVDLDKRSLIFDAVPADQAAVERTLELVTWAMPTIKRLSDEGLAMFDFVSQSMRVDEVGIVPLYRDEGYIVVPDHLGKVVHVFRYELSLFTADDEPYRAMKTVEVDTRPVAGVVPAPESIKMDLVATYKDLPNPATFLLDAELDFPFDATILPVAKRKLMRHLIS